MRPTKVVSAAAIICCAVSTTTGFQAVPHIHRTAISLHSQQNADNNNGVGIDANINNNNEEGPLGDDITNEAPRSLSSNRSFLGIRRESGVMRRMLEQQKLVEESLQSSTSNRKSSTALMSSPTALMPDGGLSPCVIKVLGVGGGGSNAVRFCFHILCFFLCVFVLFVFFNLIIVEHVQQEHR